MSEQATSSDGRRPGAGIQAVGFIFAVVGVIVGWYLGDEYRLVDDSGFATIETFNWALAAVAFAPLFVGGLIAMCSGSIIAAIYATCGLAGRSASDVP